MQKKNLVITGIIVVVVLAVGGYALLHKSSTPSYSSTSGSGSHSNSSDGSSSSNSQSGGVNNTILATKTNSSVGQYLATPSGQALYTFGGDSNGTSTCTGSCIDNWPAYQDSGATTGLPANLSTLKRSDNGQIQFTYKGMPLYTFVGDATGQVTGDGVSNFHIAKP